MDPAARPFWVSAFLDFPAATYDAAVEFWSAVTGWAVSPPRGDHAEFATLLPPSGDACLKVQRIGDDAPRVHLDLHVPDPRAAADAAVAAGAVELTAEPAGELDDRGYVVVRSPGGLVLCFVTHPGADSPPSTDWGDGGRSVVDQVCLDLPVAAYDAEAAFWREVTGWQWQPVSSPEFARLVGPGMPWRFLVQRLGEADGPARAHLDFAVARRPAETRRHARHGAVVVAEQPHWTVLRDPAGAAYCLTDRLPR